MARRGEAMWDGTARRVRLALTKLARAGAVRDLEAAESEVAGTPRSGDAPWYPRPAPNAARTGVKMTGIRDLALCANRAARCHMLYR